MLVQPTISGRWGIITNPDRKIPGHDFIINDENTTFVSTWHKPQSAQPTSSIETNPLKAKFAKSLDKIQ